MARKTVRPVIEIVENKKRVISDGKLRVEIYDIGPYWHANEELIVYLPQHRLLFEGDLFTSGFGPTVPVAQDNALFLAEKIRELGLDVDEIVGTHGRRRNVTELWKSTELRRQMK